MHPQNKSLFNQRGKKFYKKGLINNLDKIKTLLYLPRLNLLKMQNKEKTKFKKGNNALYI